MVGRRHVNKCLADGHGNGDRFHPVGPVAREGLTLLCIVHNLYVAALIDGKHVSKQLPVIRKALTCYKLLEVLLKEIECCPGLMTSQKIADGERCTHCGRTNQLSSSKGLL